MVMWTHKFKITIEEQAMLNTLCFSQTLERVLLSIIALSVVRD